MNNRTKNLLDEFSSMFMENIQSLYPKIRGRTQKVKDEEPKLNLKIMCDCGINYII